MFSFIFDKKILFKRIYIGNLFTLMETFLWFAGRFCLDVFSRMYKTCVKPSKSYFLLLIRIRAQTEQLESIKEPKSIFVSSFSVKTLWFQLNANRCTSVNPVVLLRFTVVIFKRNQKKYFSYRIFLYLCAAQCSFRFEGFFTLFLTLLYWTFVFIFKSSFEEEEHIWVVHSWYCSNEYCVLLTTLSEVKLFEYNKQTLCTL